MRVSCSVYPMSGNITKKDMDEMYEHMKLNLIDDVWHTHDFGYDNIDGRAKLVKGYTQITIVLLQQQLLCNAR